MVEVKRDDSWYNALTGLGSSLRDKLHSTRFVAGLRIDDQTLENLYHDEDMAARIVDAVPEDALRQGYKLSVEDDIEISEKAEEYEKKLGFRKQLKDAAVWARVFGGAVVWLGVDDGQTDDKPVNMNGIRSILFANVLTKREILPESVYHTPEKYGKPEMYRVNTIDGKNFFIHESRLLRLDGSRTSLRRRQFNSGWSDSILQKVHDVLMQFNIGWAAVAHLLQDASQAVFSIDGLSDMIAGGHRDILNTRMEIVDMGRSVARAIMLDADKEKFERQPANFGNVDAILNMFMYRLAAAARMPVTKLMGRSPAGMNATGDSDTQNWYDQIKVYQEESLAPAIEKFYTLLLAAQDFDGQAPEKWSVHFNRLWQMTDLEQATLEKTIAERDAIYIDKQVLLPEEVALSRFRPDGFHPETMIDLDARQSMLDAEITKAIDKAGEDDPPPPTFGAPQPGADNEQETTEETAKDSGTEED